MKPDMKKIDILAIKASSLKRKGLCNKDGLSDVGQGYPVPLARVGPEKNG